MRDLDLLSLWLLILVAAIVFARGVWSSAWRTLSVKEARENYCTEEAATMAQLCEAAYMDEAEATKSATSIGSTEVRLIESDSTEAIVAKIGETVFVAFRGTEFGKIRRVLSGGIWRALADIFSDARVFLKKVNGIPGRVHSGFGEGAYSVGKELNKAIIEMGGESPRVVIGGHSKGGAEALIFSLLVYIPEVVSIHVFGAPAVGNAAFCEEFQGRHGKRTFTHVFRSDVVARSPIILRAFGIYRTVGFVVQHDGSGVRPFSFLNYLRDSVASHRRGGRDHRLLNYVESLKG